MQFKVNDDLKLVSVGKGGAKASAKASSKKEPTKEELVELLNTVKMALVKAQKQGKQAGGKQGGFFGMLLGPIVKMISNGVQGKKWNDGIGLLGGTIVNERTPMALQGKGVHKVGGKKAKAPAKAKPKRKLPEALKRRNQLVKAVMAKTKLGMKDALIYMKQHNIK